MPQITVDQLTESKLDGAGVFDKLMASVEAHIQQEYAKNRIKGPEYSTVYLGALQSTLDQSIKFLLTKDEVLLREKQAALIDKQIAELEARIALVNQQTANAITENSVLVAQECKLRAEYDLLIEQKIKTVSESALLAQKKVTEQAQTSGTGIDSGSVIGRQIALYNAQANGYLRDAEQKATKILVDTWNVRRTTNETTEHNDINKLGDSYIGQAIERLLNGIGQAV